MKVQKQEIIDGKVQLVIVEVPDEPIPVEVQIQELKQHLADTDYQAIKFAEGVISAEEYEPIKRQRQLWREQINSLENN